MVKVAFLIVLLAITLPCFAASDFTVSPSGNDTACIEDSDNDCLTLAGAFAAMGNETYDSLTISFSSGNYNGTNNVGVSFPNTTVTLKSSSDSDVVFDCQGANITAFDLSGASVQSLTVDGDSGSFSIEGCEYGINFAPTNEEMELTLEDVTFYQVQFPVIFQASVLSADDCFFNSTVRGIVVNNATTVSVEESMFYGAQQDSFYIRSMNGLSSVAISNCTFTSTTGLVFDVAPFFENANATTPNDFNGDIEECIFEDISNAAISFTDNDWSVEDCQFINVASGVVYAGTTVYTTLLVDNSDIQTSGVAVSYDAPGTLQVAGEGFINSVGNGIVVTQANKLKLGNDDDDEVVSFTGTGEYAINVDCVSCKMDIEFDNPTFNNSGPLYFNIGDDSNSTISELTFTFPTGRALQIQGGVWGIDSVTVSDSSPVNGDGGAFYLSSTSGNATFDISDCSVTGASAQNGGAIFVSYASVNIDGCTFENNIASGSGGAVFVEKFVNGSFSVFGGKTTFSGNVAASTGGAIDLESDVIATNVTLDACFDSADFTNNNATNGAAISCCNNSGCNITIVYDTDGEVSFENNFNSNADGIDVTCSTRTGDCDAAASDPNVNVSPITDPGNSDWIMWLVISLAVLLVIGLVVAGGVGVYFYRKRMSYATVE